LGAVTLL